MNIRTATLLFLLVAANYASTQSLDVQKTLLVQFDQEHDPANKEMLLQEITRNSSVTNLDLLHLAQSSTNLDTRWMAMRGMSALHCLACVPFLESSLRDPDSSMRANAARSLGDFKSKRSAPLLLIMFTAEENPGAIEQASLSLQDIHARNAVPAIRDKIPHYTWQTRGWLLAALGSLGSDKDVPMVAGYLDSPDMASAMASASALQQLTGIEFEAPSPPTGPGPSGYPPASLVKARKWWNSHKDSWPRCDDCHLRASSTRPQLSDSPACQTK